MLKLPKISVVTITYGHQDYILDTLKGVLMQEYNGEIEFIIANDNSPDETHRVVTEFLNTNSIPPRFEIKYTKHEKNLGMMPNFIWALKQATGDYIAMCEGDDYWIDPLKLQKQVDFLEKNDEYIACGHWRIITNANGNPLYDKENLNNKIVNLSTQCVLFRNVKFSSDFNNYFSNNYFLGENFLYKYLMQFGKFKILHFYGAIYRLNEGGVWGLIGQEKQLKLAIKSREGMQFFFKNNFRIFSIITEEKSKLLIDYGIFLISQKNRKAAIKCLLFANRELLRIGYLNLFKKVNFNINVNFIWMLIKGK